MCYNPSQIIQYIKNKLTASSSDFSVTEFTPYYEGFKGTIQKINEEGKYLFKGKYEKLASDKIRVTELPIGYWTDDFKEYLESLTETVDKNGKKINPIVKEYDDMSRDTTVDFIVTLHKGKLAELEAVSLDHGCNGLEKQLKLFTTNNTTNMHLFDAHDKLKKYEKVQEIINDYSVTRVELYQKRKEYLIGALSQDLMLLSNKSRYITELLEGSVDLRRKKKEEVVQMLKNKKYETVNQDEEYKYLVKLPMDSVTEENVARLNKEHADKVAELEYVKTTTTSQMWLKELEMLEKEYNKYREARENADKVVGKTHCGSSEKKKVKKALLVSSE
jgi:DNA topoisomerase-2